MATVNLYVFNIKLLSNDRAGEEAYQTLFEKLYKSRIYKTVSRNTNVILRSQYKREYKNISYLYGWITTFTHIESNQWYDYEKNEAVEFELPPNLFPNMSETEYIFIPAAHRFCMVHKANTVTLNQAEKFLTRALNDIIEKTEDIEVIVEKDKHTIEYILEAQVVKWVELKISYTNDDFNEEFEQLLDEQLKDMHAGRFQARITADSTGDLKTKDNLLEGMIRLSQSNGDLKARIIDNVGIEREINTKEFPNKVPVDFIEENTKIREIVHKILSIFRPDEQ